MFINFITTENRQILLELETLIDLVNSPLFFKSFNITSNPLVILLLPLLSSLLL